MSEADKKDANTSTNPSTTRRDFLFNAGVGFATVGAVTKIANAQIEEGIRELGITAPQRIDQGTLPIPLTDMSFNVTDALVAGGAGLTAGALLSNPEPEPARRKFLKTAAIAGATATVSAVVVGKCMGSSILNMVRGEREHYKAANAPQSFTERASTPDQPASTPKR